MLGKMFVIWVISLTTQHNHNNADGASQMHYIISIHSLIAGWIKVIAYESFITNISNVTFSYTVSYHSIFRRCTYQQERKNIFINIFLLHPRAVLCYAMLCCAVQYLYTRLLLLDYLFANLYSSEFKFFVTRFLFRI